MVPPIEWIPLKLYISATNESIECLLAQNNLVGHEQAIYYLSSILTPAEIKYSFIKNCVLLYTLLVLNWDTIC